MAEPKKQDQEQATDEPKQSYFLPDYMVTVVATSMDEAISIAKKQSKKDEGGK
jgi:hypothetical protein